MTPHGSPPNTAAQRETRSKEEFFYFILFFTLSWSKSSRSFPPCPESYRVPVELVGGDQNITFILSGCVKDIKTWWAQQKKCVERDTQTETSQTWKAPEWYYNEQHKSTRNILLREWSSVFAFSFLFSSCFIWHNCSYFFVRLLIYDELM